MDEVNDMTEKDLDIAIEKCERIMEMDARTMQNPVSENGWIFEKVYELLQYLRQFQFATDTNVGGNLIDRQAAIDAVQKYFRKIQLNPEMLIDALITMTSAQPGEDIKAMCGECDAWNQYKNYPQPGWIPCTPDTMPQEDGEYLVTIHWESGGYYTDLLAYKAYWKEWKDEDRIFGTVIAWQPLPKPWEGDANG